MAWYILWVMLLSHMQFLETGAIIATEGTAMLPAWDVLNGS